MTKKKISIKIFYLVLALALAFVTSSLVIPKGDEKSPTQNENANQNSSVIKSVKTESLGNFYSTKEQIEYPGIVANLQDVKLVSKSNGTASGVNFEVGDKVNVGKLLAQIEDIGTNASTSGGVKNDQVKQAENAVEQAEKSLDLAEESYDNLKDASKEDLKILKIAVDQAETLGDPNQIKIAKNQLESAEKKNDTQLEAAKTQIELAKLQLKNASLSLSSLKDSHRVTAPFSGTITQKSIAEGETVSIGQVLGNISKIENAKIRFYVSKEELEKIQKGTQINFTYNDKSFGGEVITVSPKADSTTKRFLVEAKPTDSEFLLPAETVVTVSLEIERVTEGKNLFILPLSSVTVGQNENYIFIVEGQKAKKISVVIRKITGEKAEVEIDLPSQSQVIIEGNKLVSDGEEVIVKN